MARNHRDTIRTAVEASIAAKRKFLEQNADLLIAAACAAAGRVRAGGTLLLFGNGGSAADAQHIASEFVNRLSHDRAPIAALALTTDSSALTSIANDDCYERIFARQIEALGRANDVAIGISTSGNSGNVVAALAAARARGILTIGFLGRDGGACAKLCDHPVVVEDGSTQRVQEVHILLGHTFAEIVEDELGLGSPA